MICINRLVARWGSCCAAAAIASFAVIAAPTSSAHAGFDRFWEASDPPKISAKSNGYDRRSAKRKSKGVRVAALGTSYLDYGYSPTAPEKSLTGGVRWVASSGCLNAGLAAVIYQVAANFGPVTVSSTCRSKRHNARVRGARRSHHLSGDAADFRVRGNARAVHAFLRSSSSVGGLKHYGGGLFHIDSGARRTW